MANEVTINIESSLAAMAFVVADQQEDIKLWRNEYAHLEKKSEKLKEKLYYAEQNCEAQSKLMDNMRSDTKDARIERDKYCRDLANKEEECAVLHQKNDELTADIKDLSERLRNATDDFNGMVEQRDKLIARVNDIKASVSKSHVPDFHWEPWPEGKECITIPFDNLKEKDCFPFAFVMHEVCVCIPSSPVDGTHDEHAPWMQIYMVNVNMDKRIVSIYAQSNMKPRLFALVYPKDLITANALSSFRLQQQGDNNKK